MNEKTEFLGFALKRIKAAHIVTLMALNLFLWAFHFFLFRPTTIDMYEMRANPFFDSIFSLRDFFPPSFYLAHPFRRFSIIVIVANLIALQLTGFDFIHGPMTRLKEWVEAQNQKASFLFMFYWTVIIAAPAVIVLYFILNYSIVIPYMDTWYCVESLEKYFSGTFTMRNLWEWYGGGFHRNVFHRLLQIVIADFFHWQFVYINLITFILAGITFILVSIKFIAKRKNLFSLSTCTFLPLVSTAVFSVRFTETWIWDQGIDTYLCITPIVLAFFLLTGHPEVSWKRLVLAFCLGFFANASFTAGVAFWPVVIVLILSGKNSLIKKIIMSGVWIVAALVFLKIYFIGYGQQNRAEPLFSFIQDIEIFINFFLVCLGGTLPHIFCAKIFALMGLIYFSYEFCQIVLDKQKTDTQMRFFLALGFFAILACLLISVGRYSLGVLSALVFNYASYSNLFYIALFGLLVARVRKSPLSTKLEPRIAFVLMLSTLVMHLISFNYFDDLILKSRTANQYKNQLLSGENLSDLFVVSQTPQELEKWTKILKKRRLNIFYS